MRRCSQQSTFQRAASELSSREFELFVHTYDWSVSQSQSVDRCLICAKLRDVG